MSAIFADREPTQAEIERLRLLLSTYQDGTGMNAVKGGRTLPGWRDLERAAAIVFGGTAQESKALFDVLIPDPDRRGVTFGIACKMRRELNRLDREGRLYVEVSNSNGKFWQHLATKQIDESNYRDNPSAVGCALVQLVEQWYKQISLEGGGPVDLTRSSYLVLLWNKRGIYQFHRLPVTFPDPQTLSWSVPTAKRIIGTDAEGKALFEWYGKSGGQLKYYPPETWATWRSNRFQLEPLPEGLDLGVAFKAATYFPDKWRAVSGDEAL